ncbi:MAG: rubrerythrin family protein [Desulfarculaceae bacterium]|nr:rubrerythrin family protein [Desulfarculaceae bacterium]MCF8072721.1 rubrerythrin family protein [Desulfarculaceae bacterium]MCF8102600.1 rubrerythrin family protein [Desulfarculaceae bacterium]MCF8116509.1 rubrerythrin family protein [Desulfarculaceae bacterium]
MKRWRCTVCGYVHQGKSPPDPCPQCGAPMNRFVLDQPLEPELEEMVRAAFAGEAKAAARNSAFARRAKAEGLPQVAALFAAVAEAERVHAAELLPYLEGAVGSTEENLQAAFEHEIDAKSGHYPPIIAQAIKAKRPDLEWALVRSRDVETRHAELYKRALGALAAEREVTYHVCEVCGYVFDGSLPDKCPVCLSGKDKFKKIG